MGESIHGWKASRGSRFGLDWTAQIIPLCRDNTKREQFWAHAIFAGDSLRQVRDHGRMNSINAQQALERLQAGNRRFTEAIEQGQLMTRLDPLKAPLSEQRPFAIVIGCSDSRVPVEMVFDQGLGDLFVIRVAGNIVAPSQVGSVEFAAEKFGTRLVVVLGHTGCGAVLATLEQLAKPSGERSMNLAAIVDRIRPAVLPLLQADPPLEHDQLAHMAVRANIRATTEKLSAGSPLLAQLIKDDGLRVVGAEYCLGSGRVEFLGSTGAG